MRSTLLLHGLTNGPTLMWRFQQWFEAEGWNVTARSLLGHGGRGPGAPYTFDRFAEDALEAGDFDVVLGHSLGCAAAAVASVRRPSFGKRLVMVDPAWYVPDRIAADARQSFVEDVKNGVDDFLRLHPEWHPFDNYAKALEVERLAPGAETGPFDDNEHWDVREAAKRIPVPTLVVNGDADLGSVLPQAVVDELLPANPNLVHRSVAGAGHNIVRDKPEELRRVILDWLAATD